MYDTTEDLRRPHHGRTHLEPLDAFSNNFRVTVAEEACFDRSQASHAINLCDMQAKYADVLPVEEVKRYLASLPKGLFELPRGS